ncbi:MAG: prenyltransferase/squalene oxidase repeat-containing protein, partial [Planctomycetota bacterium]
MKRHKSIIVLWVVVWILLLRPAGGDIPKRPDMITPKTEKAIEKGLKYLARNQCRDGSWRSEGMYGTYPTAMTGLAGMAFLCEGSTPTRGRYSRSVARAVNYLLRCQDETGLICSPAGEGRSMYGHGFSTLFLGEVYGMNGGPERDQRLHNTLTRAVQLIARAQSALGGWYYTPESRHDEGSVTVTQMQALRACRNGGIYVPKETVDNAVKYIENSECADGGIAYRASRGGRGRMGGSRPAITAAAVATLYNAGNYESPVAEKALAYCKRRLGLQEAGTWRGRRAFGGHFYYAHYYMAQAMYQSGEENWKEYFPRIRDILLQSQDADGAWQGDGVGRVYGTAIALTILQLPYKK